MRPWRLQKYFILSYLILICFLLLFYYQLYAFMYKSLKCMNNQRLEYPADKIGQVKKIEQNQQAERFQTACDLLRNGEPLKTNQVVNPHLFVNTIVPKTDCRPNSGVYLVVYVHSSPQFFLRRSTIRRTWGNVSQYDVPIRLIFVVGETADKVNTSNALQEEAKRSGDLLQSNFSDTYHNLTIKAVTGLKWVTEHCRSAKYVLKTDDDTFVNIYLLMQLLKIETRQAQYANHVLLCNIYSTTSNPYIVNREGKWKTTKEECSLEFFPPFCQGIGFAMTMDVAISLYNASYYVPLLWMDDVYVTGLLPALLPVGTVKLVDASSFYMSTWKINQTESHKVLSGPDAYKFIYYHESSSKLVDLAWRTLLKIVRKKQFNIYADTLLSINMRLERKRLANIPCTKRLGLNVSSSSLPEDLC